MKEAFSLFNVFSTSQCLCLAGSETGINIFIWEKIPTEALKMDLNMAISDCTFLFTSSFRPPSEVMWSWLYCSPSDISNLIQWHHLILKLETRELSLNFHLSTHPVWQQILFILLKSVYDLPLLLHPHCLHRPLSIVKYSYFSSAFRENVAFTRHHSISWVFSKGASMW